MPLGLVVVAAAGDELPGLLSRAGADIHVVAAIDEALELARKAPPDALVVDADRHEPASLAETVRRVSPVPLLAVGRGGAKQAVLAMRAGARDFLELPFAPGDLGVIADALLAVPEDDAVDVEQAATLLGSSKRMQHVHDIVRRVAPTDATVLVRGESGTGKELVARALHEAGARRDGPFVKVHCAGLPETLLESELFGYERGAFTGATCRKPGRVEVAEGGTLFFDEIGDIALPVQVKLLRLLQDRRYERLGGNEPLETNARFIAATHRNLEQMVKDGEFREDLFYRLNVVPLWLPPLRARRTDIAELATRFCAAFARAHGKPGLALSSDALDALGRERWPGNVRQLQNFVERLVVLAGAGVIDAKDVARELAPEDDFITDGSVAAASPPTLSVASRTGPVIPLDEILRASERSAIERALRHTNGNRALAARLLRVGRATLYKKIAALGIDE